MIFKKKTKPTNGDVRTSIKFAWWPTKTVNHFYNGFIWLEKYTVKERWYTFYTGYDNDGGCWDVFNLRPINDR